MLKGEAFLYFAAVAAVSCQAAAGRPTQVVDTVGRALTIPCSAVMQASLVWRRGHAHLHLGRPDLCRADLVASRELLAADDLSSPRELLGCLVTEALLVHGDDPSRAARILGSVEGHRTTNLGRWVLPHGTDRDVDRLSALLLLEHQSAYDTGFTTRPKEYVRTTPL